MLSLHLKLIFYLVFTFFICSKSVLICNKTYTIGNNISLSWDPKSTESTTVTIYLHYYDRISDQMSQWNVTTSKNTGTINKKINLFKILQPLLIPTGKHPKNNKKKNYPKI